MRNFIFLSFALLGLMSYGQMTQGNAETYHNGTQSIEAFFNNGKYELRDINRNFETKIAREDPKTSLNSINFNSIFDNDNNWEPLKSISFVKILSTPSAYSHFTIVDNGQEVFDSRTDSQNNIIVVNKAYYLYGLQLTDANPIIKFYSSFLDFFPEVITLNLNEGLQNDTSSNGISIEYEVHVEPNYVVDVHRNLTLTYDYFKNVHNREGLGGYSDNIIAYVYRGNKDQLTVKAFARPSTGIFIKDILFFGAGRINVRKPQTGLEIVAHEYTHLLLAREEKFQRINTIQDWQGFELVEKRAINESICDAFGIIINHYYKTNGFDPNIMSNNPPPINWIIYDQGLGDYSGEVLRDVSNPDALGMINNFPGYLPKDNRKTDTYEYVQNDANIVGDNILNGPNWVAESYNEGEDMAYKNMGPANFWFYLIANEDFKVNPQLGVSDKGTNYSVRSLGIEKIQHLLYYVITESNDVDNNSEYEEFANATINTAFHFLDNNLHGFTFQDVQSVIDAWYAVGVIPNVNEFCDSGNVLTSTVGNLSDGSLSQNYNNDQNCSWIIAPNGASSVTLNFIAFNLGNGDSVSVYDGLDNSGTTLGTFSGSTIPDEITSTTGAVFIEFFTDASDVGQGWTLSYTSTVPNENCNTLTELYFASAVFDDGSGNDNYLNNSNCTWRIAPEGATFINLDFQFIDIENSQDFVTIYDGLDENAPPIGTYTGNTIPPTITANSGTAFVKFTSNNVTTTEGWAISYTSDGIEPCFGTTTLTDNTGTVSDGSGADNYGNNANCSWLIQPPNATSITVVFDELNLQQATIDGNTTTINDYLEIYDGIDDQGNLIAFYTGNQLLPLIVQSNSGSLFVKFVTNSSVTDSGWQFTYEASYDDFCAGTNILEATSGTITDGSGTGNYNSNSDCRWLIQPENATSIELDVTFLDTELGKDGIVVYDGPNTSYPFISYSGSNLPSKIYSTGGAMLIRFLSDDVNEFQGFEANYVANIAPEGNPNSMVKYQYWFNDDYSNAINENNFGAVNSLNINVQASTLNLNDGINTLHIRTKDKIGLWSSVLSEYIYVQKPTGGLNNEITEYEYWFNDDYGSRISGTGNNSNPFVLGINEGVGDLAIGLNTFHIRFKDKKGLWSSITSEYVYNNKPSGLGTNVITGYRYWFNDDYDNRVSLEITQNETLTLIEDIDVSNLQPSSTNLIHFQFKDLYGNWSSVVTEEFFFQTLSTNGIDSSSFGVYPNPTNGKIFIVSQYQEGILELYNALGKKIMSLETVPSELDLTNLQDGIYVLKIVDKEKIFEKKIIKF
ncbi:putative secreted protein (Por secretion system target) [Winogradskyella wandonensis]|uniref:Putative secreted protein (Por secretion system target) n=1 Tax=Winogradskyella wandonensis TaxID=1442586 RepID=A0A4R1KQD9_9FLAO|nr:CUB domain-containing protein [Winogradskyella wandonensis]TCK67238.1 putative secreted protein (Por secretion system target) [Winogradskyella wandonensis]